MLRSHFTDHPASVGETYWQHLGMAASFGYAMFLGAFACLAHAIFPFLFEKTGSRIIGTLHDRMIVNRARQSTPRQIAPGSDTGVSAQRTG